MMRNSGLLCLALALGCLVGLSVRVSAQEYPRGQVFGRVLDENRLPLGDVTVQLLVRRGSRDVVIRETRSSPTGQYRLQAGPLFETPHLRFLARDHATRDLQLKSLRNGEGLLVPDVVLTRGREVLVEISCRLALESSALQLLVFPLPRQGAVIDLDGPALASVPIEGLRASAMVEDGKLAFVVVDRNEIMAPEMLVWQVGPGTSTLPPIEIMAGRRLACEVTTFAAMDYEASLVFGSGVWHPEGGREYRLHRRTRGHLRPEAPNVLEWRGLCPSVCAVTIESPEAFGTIEAVPGDENRRLEMQAAGRLKGAIVRASSTEKIENALVQIGPWTAFTDAEGRYQIRGIRPGTWPLHVGAVGHLGASCGHLSYDHPDVEQDFDHQLEPGARISGVARDDELDPLPGVLLGCDPVRSQDLGFGRYCFAVSDQTGEFELGGIAPGRVRVSILTPGSAISVDDELDVELNAQLLARPRLGRASSVKGRLEAPDGEAAAGVDVYFIRAPAPLDFLHARRLDERADGLAVHHARSDENGVYRFEGLLALPYDRVLISRQGAPTILPRVLLAIGTNDVGMDWKLAAPSRTLLDIPEEVALILKHEAALVDDIWLYRPNADSAPIVELLPGRYRIEMQRGGISRFAGDEQLYRERLRPQVLGQFSTPRFDKVETRVPDPVHFEDLELTILVNGDPPAEQVIELTVYPLAGSWLLKPMRIPTEVGMRHVDLKLPRGVYLFHGRQAGLSEGWAGPYTLGTGFSEKGQPRATLDLQPLNVVLGRIAPEVADISGERVMEVTIEPAPAFLIRPYRSPAARTAVTVDGQFRLDQVVTGTSRMTLRAQDLALERELQLEAFQIIDLGEIIPESERHPVFDLDLRALVGAKIEDGRAGADEIDVASADLRGPYLLGLDVEGELGTEAVRLFRLGEGDGAGERISRASILDDARSSLRLQVLLDGLALRGWPLKLLPIQSDGYDYERMGVDFITDDEGRVAADGLGSGSHALRFDYDDDAGLEYVVAVSLQLASSAAAQRERVNVVTSPLKVVAKDARDGSALREARIRLKRTDLRGLEQDRVFRRDIATVVEGRSNLDGELRFELLPLGTYDIEVSYPGLVTQRIPGFQLAEKGPLRVVQLELAPGRRAELRLVSERGTPIAGLRVFLFDQSGFPVHDDRLLLSDEDGRLELASLPEGPIALRVQGRSHPAQYLGRFETVLGRRVFETFRVKEGARLEISCRDAGGRPLPGAEIVIEKRPELRLQGPEARPHDEVPLKTSPSGQRSFLRVAPGEFLIRVEKEGYIPSEESVILQSGERHEVVLKLERIP